MAALTLKEISQSRCRENQAGFFYLQEAQFSSGGGGVLPIMAYTGRLRPKGVPFSGFRYIKGQGFNKFRYMKG